MITAWARDAKENICMQYTFTHFVITYIVYINMIRGSQHVFACLSFPCPYPYPYPYPCRSQPPFGTVVIPASGRTAT